MPVSGLAATTFFHRLTFAIDLFPREQLSCMGLGLGTRSLPAVETYRPFRSLLN